MIVVDLHAIFDGLICLMCHYIACIVILVDTKQFVLGVGYFCLPGIWGGIASRITS